jgi:sugar fermentation stimulation protein A
MTGCIAPGAPILLSHSENPKRKYSYTLELVKMPSSWVCVNTQQANRVGLECLEAGLIPELRGYVKFQREVVYPNCKSRVDVVLTDECGNQCFVEIKSTTLVEDGVAKFPDAPTVRGQKHLDDLASLVTLGIRPVVLFLVLRNDALSFEPAYEIDPIFAQKLRDVSQGGVEVLAYHVETSPQGLFLREKLEVTL